MASNIEMVTFAGQTVTPLDDALIYDAALTSGILSGCSVSLSGGNTIHIEGGHGIICGRKFTIFESDIPVPLSSGATLAGRLKVHMDLSDTGEPIQLVVESAATLPALEQDEDANINNGIYEFNIATFNVTTSEVTNFVQVFPSVGVDPEFIVNNMTTPAGTSGKALDARQANPNISGTLAALVAAKVAKTDIVNSGATAAGTSGKVLDARQANPAISGSLAYQISQLNSRLDETFPSGKILRISSGNSTKVRISGITVGSASPIPCWIGERAGALYISRNGSEVSAVKFVGTDKPTNALTLNKASDGTWYVDITATAWTPFMFIWFVNPNTDGNISISTV